jgi:glyoxylase-like metal-dependent hydrolase (beta-lactamase superfamily II)/8-oxo-dGTP pyrophosphatase MutT (NUDIX family)
MSLEIGGNLYEALLAGLAASPGGGAGALPPARASASVVPWRRTPAGAVEVYWVQRSEELPFMGGWHAFPGGGLARTDAEIPVIAPAAAPGGGAGTTAAPAGAPGPISAPAPSGAPAAASASHPPAADPTPDLAPGILACAIRELFEETGILLARPDGAVGEAAAPAAPVPGAQDRGAAGPPPAAPRPALPPSAALAAARRELLGGRPFAAVLQELGLHADASRLVYAGRWLTPPFAPLRFDNRFFLLEWPRGEAIQPEVLPGELVTGTWIDPTAAWESWHRGDVLAAPPILHLLRVLAGDGPEAGLPRLLDPSEADLGPVRRIELRPGVLLFPLATRTLPPAATTNAYLLGFGDAVLVDPGATDPAEIDRLAAALAAARERLGRRVVAIWLTHHHPDHVGGVPDLRRRLGVPVLAHPATAERLAAHGIAVDGTLEDGREVTLAGLGRPEAPDMVVEVVHTPGHARGHLCFLERGQRSLLAGDMVAGLGTIVVDPPEGDMDDYLASLARLAALAPRTLFPGHGPAVKNAVSKLREYIEHRLWREQRVLAAWREGRREPEAMLPAVYDDVPREAHPLAARQILAHLARLRRAGQLDEP